MLLSSLPNHTILHDLAQTLATLAELEGDFQADSLMEEVGQGELMAMHNHTTMAEISKTTKEDKQVISKAEPAEEVKTITLLRQATTAVGR